VTDGNAVYVSFGDHRLLVALGHVEGLLPCRFDFRPGAPGRQIGGEHRRTDEDTCHQSRRQFHPSPFLRWSYRSRYERFATRSLRGIDAASAKGRNEWWNMCSGPRNMGTVGVAFRGLHRREDHRDVGPA
jgi:hypothetical protein